MIAWRLRRIARENALMIDQSKVKSGFDVEALLGEKYLTALLLTAYDSGIIPSKIVLEEPHVIIELAERSSFPRLYEAAPES